MKKKMIFGIIAVVVIAALCTSFVACDGKKERLDVGNADLYLFEDVEYKMDMDGFDIPSDIIEDSLAQTEDQIRNMYKNMYAYIYNGELVLYNEEYDLEASYVLSEEDGVYVVNGFDMYGVQGKVTLTFDDEKIVTVTEGNTQGIDFSLTITYKNTGEKADVSGKDEEQELPDEVYGYTSTEITVYENGELTSKYDQLKELMEVVYENSKAYVKGNTLYIQTGNSTAKYTFVEEEGKNVITSDVMLGFDMEDIFASSGLNVNIDETTEASFVIEGEELIFTMTSDMDAVFYYPYGNTALSLLQIYDIHFTLEK